MMMRNNTEAQDPILDPTRLEEIARLRLHEDEVDEILNEYVKEAATEFNLGVGLVSIVLDGIQRFAGSYGLDGWIKEMNSTPVEWSFCANSVRTGSPFVVSDAKEHDIVKDNPLVTIDNIVCYAGAPMITSNGINIGNFCVIGDTSRSFTEEEINKLKEYASKAVTRIEDRIK